MNRNDVNDLIFGIMTMMVLAKCTSAAPVDTLTCIPPRKILDNEVGLCNNNGSVDKWTCPSCPHGFGLSVECGNIYNVGIKIECVPCKRGYQYSDTNDFGQCKPCQKCGHNEKLTGHCVEDKDTIKCLCKKGFYRDDLSKDCKSCSWCCDDGSNKNMTECNDQGLSPQKRCSFQDRQLCDPTVALKTLTTIDSVMKPIRQTENSASKPLFTKEPSQKVSNIANNASSNNNNSATKVSKLGIKKTSDINWMPISVVVLVVIVLVIIAFFIRHYSRKHSTSDTSSSGSQSLETSNSFLNGEELESNKNPGDQKETERVNLHPHEMTAEFHVEQVPLLHTNGKCIGASGHSIAESTSMVCTTDNQHGIHLNPSVSIPPRPFSYEQKLLLPVAAIPEDIYTDICKMLDAKEPFFRDKRMLAEKLCVKSTASTSTNALLKDQQVIVKDFLDILNASDMGRKDVVEIIEKWLNQS